MIVYKPVVGFEEFYEISSSGEIRSLPRLIGMWHRKYAVSLKPRLSKHGYHLVDLRGSDGKKSQCSVHRLVAQHFLENYSEELEVDHLNGIRVDNRVENLDMVTAKENCLRKNRRANKVVGCYFDQDRGSWASAIRTNGKTLFLGRFQTKDEAHEAYYNKYLELYGVKPWNF